MWQNWTNAVLGLLVILVAFMGLQGSSLTWTLGILGAAIALMGFIGASATNRSATHKTA
ncbi:MAG: hypothetical protein Q7S01_00290 [bacterium]|nr:hypothetical protein [bacterium]